MNITPTGRIADALGRIAALIRGVERGAAPLTDLAIRLWLAQAFWVSAILKLSDWDTALLLARDEYPVAWLNPVTAALAGVGIELAAPLLLVAGLATRVAALALLGLTLVIQIEYRALDVNLFYIALFAWYVVMGAGRFSLDNSLARGLADSALPGAAAMVRALAALRCHLGASLQLTLRLWLAMALLAGGGWVAQAGLERVLPLHSAAGFAPSLALVVALLLGTGFATRFAALLLLVGALFANMNTAGVALHLYWLALAALVALYGAGALSLDALLARWLSGIYPQFDGRVAFSLDALPRVVIVGAGFGGIACAAALRRTPVQVTLIDRHNFHLFQPLLYQVATTALAPNDIATPVRALFREHAHIRVLLGMVDGVDTQGREVLVDGQRLPYDYLVLATGASHSYFGRDDWAPFAPGLKRVEDAIEVRRRILLAFERAEACSDAAERARLLTFIVVGGGPTGVELAGAIAELARFGMEKEFRRFDPATSHVLLVQSGARLLPTFPETLSASVRGALEKLGVTVLTNRRVENIDATGATVSGEHIPAGTVLWAAGVVASPAAQWLNAAADRAGRVKVGADLSVPGLAHVYAVGDTVEACAWHGQPVPGLAPAAKQGGDYVARRIRADLAGRTLPPFRYRHLGSLATVGRRAAVADFGGWHLSGATAWWLWGLIHIGFLIGLRNRVSVMWDWFWAYLTFRSGSRLITGDAGSDANPRRST